MEIRKQVTKDIDIVNIASFQNLNFEFWKDENKKDDKNHTYTYVNRNTKEVLVLNYK
ncbi:MAG TPA: hypothetical protein K8U79_06830 [Clostridium perfringens]|nr:hypothetical protein [Clostridium perfringens]